MLKLFLRSSSYGGRGPAIDPSALKKFLLDLLKTPNSDHKAEILELGLQQIIDLIEEEPY